MRAEFTFSQNRIVEAYDRGYRVEKGSLIGPKGVLSVKLYGKQRYPTFSTNWNRVYGIPVHKFAAYCYYGLDSFKEGVVVRHLNGDTLDFSKDNLVLGSHSENNLDKSKEARAAAARKARASQPKTPYNAKLTEEQVSAIRSLYEGLGGKKAPNGFTKRLCDEHGVSRTVINKVVRGVYYAG